MLNSIKKIIEINPINRIYNNTTGKTLLPVAEDTEGMATYAFLMDEAIYFVTFMKPGHVTIDEEDIESLSATCDGVETTIDETSYIPIEGEYDVDKFNTILVEKGFEPLPESYNGGVAVLTVFYTTPSSRLAGSHIFTVTDGSNFNATATYVEPLNYYLFEIECGDSEEDKWSYYVAFRNTTDLTPEWDYTEITFYCGDEVTDQIYVPEQDPGVPVTWVVDEYTLGDMTDNSKQIMIPFTGSRGFELAIIAPLSGEAYYTYGDHTSNTYFVYTE